MPTHTAEHQPDRQVLFVTAPGTLQSCPPGLLIVAWQAQPLRLVSEGSGHGPCAVLSGSCALQAS